MLQIEHLTKTYGEKKAVDDLSLHILPGEIYGFIGQRVRADGGAADADLSGVEAQDPGDGFQRCRLPRAVVADEAVNFAGQDVQAQDRKSVV